MAGKYHGYGTMTDLKGNIKEGYWINNTYLGKDKPKELTK